MPESPLPGPGRDGAQPPLGGPARDGAGLGAAAREQTVWVMPADGIDDWDPVAHAERLLADIEAGLAAVPPELPGLASGGLAVLAEIPEAACTPDGLKGLGPHGFTGGWAADEMPAGPLLAILTEQAVAGPTPFSRFPECEPLPAEAAAQAASAAAGERRLAGIPGVPGQLGYGS